MSPPPPATPSATPLPTGLAALTELAMDLHWTWNHRTDELWRRLDPTLWSQTSHPNVVLQQVGRDKLAQALADPEFCQLLERLIRTRREEAAAPAWFQQSFPQAAISCVAYFCMEYMLSEALPIYSGGLGNVAGDQLKAACTLGVPVVAVGLLYQRGYFRQVIDRSGAQLALYPTNDPGQLPVTPVRGPKGEDLRLEVELPGSSVWLRAWEVQVGRAKLYLLDSNDTANIPIHRGITGELYGGNQELRLKQELVLGLGGWRLLAALGIKPDVCHLNEGHAAFALLERARAFMEATKQPFAAALAATRVGNLFTTHTAVAAGFDVFAPGLLLQYLEQYARENLGLTPRELLALGRRDPGADHEPFNMAYLAVRGCGAINGVSRLHGRVSRHIFSPLFPRWPEAEVPIGHITNGIHVPTWDSAAADELWTKACGQFRWVGTASGLEANLRKVADETVWGLRTTSRKHLVDYARARLAEQMVAAGAEAGTIARFQSRLDPGILTLGFARRFATYKRPNLLLRDPERLLRILTNSQRPAQLILAGKAHPADQAGQDLIKAWIQFIDRGDINPPVVFLADYDMLMAEHLVQGVDVWINTPRRPWEACGTSGMKVLVNGGLNLSEIDGWWAEGYAPDIGWSLGDGQERGDDPAWDAAEAEALYDRLEHEVIPEFYARSAQGIPAAWVARIRESMARLTPRFAASRAVQDYTTRHYLPAAAAYRARASSQGAAGQQIADWARAVDEQWGDVRFGSVRITTDGEHHHFEVEVYLNHLDPEHVRAELYANPPPGEELVQQELTASGTPGEGGGPRRYTGIVAAARPVTDYTPRLVPKWTGASVPLECSRILWQR